MLPSRGLARVGPGALSKNQIFATATFRTSIGSSRQFGTSLKSHGRPIKQSSWLGLMPNRRVGASVLLSSQTFSSASTRRFASTGSEPQSSQWAESTPSSDLTPDFSSLDSIDSLNPNEINIHDIPETVGYLKELGLDYGWGPTAICEWVLEHAHFSLGLSWGWSIVAVAALIRAATFYPAFLAQRESQKMAELRKIPLYSELSQRMMSLAMKGGGAQEAAMAKMQIDLMEREHNIKKSRLAFSFLQIPFAFGMFKLCRAMAALPVPGMESQGFLWFSDLTMHDPFFILPCVSTVALVLMIRRTSANAPPQQAGLMKYLPWILGPVTVFFTVKMAASVTLYFAAGSILQYLQTSLFYNPTVRRMLGEKPLPTQGTKTGNATYQAPRATTTEIHSQITFDLRNPIKSIKHDITKAVDGYRGTDSVSAEKTKLEKDYEARRRKQQAEEYFARRDGSKYRGKQKKK